jgi:hypothetical protein
MKRPHGKSNMVQIDDELRDVLPTAIVKPIIATRETTDVVYGVCGQQTPASSPETLDLIVSHHARPAHRSSNSRTHAAIHRDSPTCGSRPSTASSRVHAGRPSDRTPPRRRSSSSKSGGAR